MTLDEALDILKVDGSMGFSEIRIVYRDLARVWHPDQYANNQRLSDKATDEFKNINSAYDIIKKHFKDKTQTTRSKHHTRQEQSHQSEQKDQQKTKESFVSVVCVNCRNHNLFSRSESDDPSVVCSNCKKNPYVKDKKTNHSQHKKKQSKEKIAFVITRCINCGTNNRIPKTKLYCSSVRCGKCGKNPHLRRKESEPVQQSVDTDEFERMKRRFSKYQNKANKPTEFSKRILLCSDSRCIGILGNDGRCKECGKYSRSTLNKVNTLCNHDTCIGFFKDNGRCGVCGKKPLPKTKAQPKKNPHIGTLILCSNSKCWGEIGSNGRCNKCGRLQMNN